MRRLAEFDFPQSAKRRSTHGLRARAVIAATAALAETLAVAATSAIGIGIGLFYRMKFGESAKVWLLAAGAFLGVAGQILTYMPGVPPLVGDLVYLPGAILLAVGTFWLWFVMLGTRR